MSTSLSPATNYDKAAPHYEQGRPEYPETAIRTLLTGVEYSPEMQICDLAAGTGKLSKAILAFHNNAHIVAIEPSEKMCQEFTRQLPDITIKQASATAIPLPDASVDILLVGTAFHWFCNEQALHEISRVLKPGGKLGLIWNIFDTRVPWVKEIRKLIQNYHSKTTVPSHDSAKWQKVFDTTNKSFSGLHHVTMTYTYQGSLQNITNRILSHGKVSNMADDKREELLQKVQRIAQQQLDAHNNITIPYRVEIYWTKKLDNL